MECYVYKSRRRADTYLYLREHDAFGAVPQPVRAVLEPFEFVLQVTLDPGRQLARVDAAQLRATLAERGWFVQHPPVPGVPEA